MDRFLRGITVCILVSVVLVGCNRQATSSSSSPPTTSAPQPQSPAPAPPASAPAAPSSVASAPAASEPAAASRRSTVSAPAKSKRASDSTNAAFEQAAIDKAQGGLLVGAAITGGGNGSGMATKSRRPGGGGGSSGTSSAAAAGSANTTAPAPPEHADRFDASPVIPRPVLGSGVIRVPTKMKQGRDSIARLIVSPDDLTTLLKDPEVTKGNADVQGTRENIHLTPKMRARLSGSGFSIEPKDFQDQAVKQGDPTVWVWTVVPEEAGGHTLVFTLEGLMMVGKQEVAIRPPALTVPVEVDVNPLYFVERHWQWLLTAIIIPVAGFFGKRWFDRRSTTPAAHS